MGVKFRCNSRIFLASDMPQIAPAIQPLAGACFLSFGNYSTLEFLEFFSQPSATGTITGHTLKVE
jgi:hypothetical protein